MNTEVSDPDGKRQQRVAMCNFLCYNPLDVLLKLSLDLKLDTYVSEILSN